MFKMNKVLPYVVAVLVFFGVFFLMCPFIYDEYSNFMKSDKATEKITLFGSFVSTFLTLFIAYQQYRIAKSQFNISRDQRNLNYNDQRIKNYERLEKFFRKFSTLYREVYMFDSHYNGLDKKLVDKCKLQNILDVENSDLPEHIKKWFFNYNKKLNKTKKIITECRVATQKCKFLLDDESYNIIFNYTCFADVFFGQKIVCLKNQMEFAEEKVFLLQEKGYLLEFNRLFEDVTSRMKPYMNVSDIIAPKKFD